MYRGASLYTTAGLMLRGGDPWAVDTWKRTEGSEFMELAGQSDPTRLPLGMHT